MNRPSQPVKPTLTAAPVLGRNTKAIEDLPAESILFLATYGQAVSLWQEIEGIVCGLFAQLVASGVDKRAALAAVRGTSGMMPKLSMVRHAATAVLDKQSLAAWSALENEIKNEAKHRNALAHGVWLVDALHEFGFSDGEYADVIGRHGDGGKQYNVKDLQTVIERFIKLEYHASRYLLSVARTLQSQRAATPKGERPHGKPV